MAAERQIPGGPFINEVGTAQRQIAGGPFVNETVAAAGGYAHPTLSAATALEIGATSFKPSVTYTFA